MLYTLRNYISIGLPSPYYDGLSEFLKNAYTLAGQKMDANLNCPESKEFIEALRFWVNVDLTKKILESTRY
jgi:hypothetical protein